MRRAGACALDLAYVAAGRLDGFWVMSLKPWDVAAGALLIKEAGGRVGDFAGGTDFLRTNEVIAAAPGVFNPLREAIAAAPDGIRRLRGARPRQQRDRSTGDERDCRPSRAAASGIRRP